MKIRVRAKSKPIRFKRKLKGKWSCAPVVDFPAQFEEYLTKRILENLAKAAELDARSSD